MEKQETLAEILDREQFEMDAKKAHENAQPLMEKMNQEFHERLHSSDHDEHEIPGMD